MEIEFNAPKAVETGKSYVYVIVVRGGLVASAWCGVQEQQRIHGL